MSKSFVVDASIGLAWVHPSQATPQADSLLAAIEAGAKVVVPAIWFTETANALLVLERRKKLTGSERKKALSRLGALAVSMDDECRLAFTTVSELAAEHGLSVYDASYLELAVRRQLPLASRDGPLREAVERCRLPLF